MIAGRAGDRRACLSLTTAPAPAFPTIGLVPASPCHRHPDVETRLTCSSCGVPICPDCLVDAAVSYQCPDCAQQRAQQSASSRSDELTTGLRVRAVAAAVAGSMSGGLVLGPVLLGGTFFLLSSGVIGWGIARLVFWASQEHSSPFLRAMALTAAGFSVAVGLVVAGRAAAPPGLLFLAYPAAVYGAWLVVRSR